MKNFTQEQVIQRAKELLQKPVCLDNIHEAMLKDTLEEAAEVLIIDTHYWDS